MKTGPNDPAFPGSPGCDGLTKFEFFAALALCGLLADHVTREEAVAFAPIAAQGLIDALNGNGHAP